MAMEYSKDQFHVLNAWNKPGQIGLVLLPQLSKNDDEEHCFLKEIGFYSADWQHTPGIDDASYSSPIFYCYNYQEAVNYCLHGPKSNLILAPSDEGIY